jgi:hypothetical protein
MDRVIEVEGGYILAFLINSNKNKFILFYFLSFKIDRCLKLLSPTVQIHAQEYNIIT